jgi:inorganic triphosphatase YgiF
MPIEVEARFRVEDPPAVDTVASMDRLGAAELGAPNAVEETDVYLDTTDGALAAARWACRLRHRRGRHTVSLKGPPADGTGGWMHRRPEVEGPATAEPVPDRWPPSEARGLVDRLRSGRPLIERLTLRQTRVERTAILGGHPVGILSVDDVSVVRDGTVIGRFGIVELELTAGHTDEEGALSGLAAALAAVPGLVAEPQSKLERALEMAGT